jgi:manganese transport protein
MVPSLIVIFLGLDPTRTLVISQVLLSFGLPFAVIPLVIFTANKKKMGILVNSAFTTILASIVAVLIVGLNIFLVFSLVTGK